MIRRLLLLALLASPALAQDRYPANTRPTCTSTPRAIMLTKQTDDQDCDNVVSGTASAYCQCLDGATWEPVSSGGGPGGSLTIQEDDATVDASASYIDFTEPDATLVTSSPAGEANVNMALYAILAGRAAGQVLDGGTSISGDLTLRANATAGQPSLSLDGDTTSTVQDTEWRSGGTGFGAIYMNYSGVYTTFGSADGLFIIDDGGFVTQAAIMGDGRGIFSSAEFGNPPTSASNTCLYIDTDRMFGDKDCDGVKDAGEEYLDEAAGTAGNSFETIDVDSGTDPVAESTTDTLIIDCTYPMDCSGDATTDTITINVDAVSTTLEYDPDVPPASGLDASASDEFTDSINTGLYTWGNQGTATVTAELDKLKMSTAASASVDRKLLWYPLPASGNWTASTKMTGGVDSHPFANFVAALAALETGTIGTPTLIDMCMVDRLNGAVLQGLYTATSYTAAYSSVWTFNLNTDYFTHGPAYYMRLRFVDSTNVLSCDVGLDGLSWYMAGSTRTTSANPTYIGLMSDQNGSNSQTDIYFDYVRLRTDTEGTTAPYPIGDELAISGSIASMGPDGAAETELYSYEYPPAVTHAYNDEFGDGMLNAKWTAFSVATTNPIASGTIDYTASLTTPIYDMTSVAGWMMLQSDSSTVKDMGIYEVYSPVTNSTFFACFGAPARDNSASTEGDISIRLTNSADANEWVGFGLRHSSTSLVPFLEKNDNGAVTPTVGTGYTDTTPAPSQMCLAMWKKSDVYHVAATAGDGGLTYLGSTTKTGVTTFDRINVNFLTANETPSIVQGIDFFRYEEALNYSLANTLTIDNGVFVAEEDNSTVDSAARRIDFTEPDTTLVTSSPSGEVNVDMSKYALLEGRTDAQTLYGGTTIAGNFRAFANDDTDAPRVVLDGDSTAPTAYLMSGPAGSSKGKVLADSDGVYMDFGPEDALIIRDDQTETGVGVLNGDGTGALLGPLGLAGDPFTPSTQSCAASDSDRWFGDKDCDGVKDSGEYYFDEPNGTGGTSDSFATVTPTSGTSPVADSPTDTLNVNCTSPLTCTGNSATDTLSMVIDEVEMEYDPKIPPTTFGTGGWGEEWTGNVADQSWSWGNQGTATETIENDGATMTTTAVAADAYRVRCLAAPASGDYTLHSLFSMNGTLTFNQAGIMLLQGTLATPTRLDHVTLVSITDTAYDIRHDSHTTYAGGGGATHFESADFNEASGVGRELYARIAFTDTSNTVTTGFSWDGKLYGSMSSAINIGGNPTFLCYYISSTDAAAGVTAHFQFVRLRTDARMAWPSDATPLFPGAGGSGGATDSFVTVDAATGTNPVASGIDTLVLATGAAALTVDGDSGTQTVTFDITGTASKCARFDASGELVAASDDCPAGDTGAGGAGSGLTHPQVMARASLRF